ncbi:MAG: thioredoxin [archaeon]
MVMPLTTGTFEKEVLKHSTPVIVDFWAVWCAPCKMLAPRFEELESEYQGKLKFAKINVDENPETAQAHEISGIPCLVLFSHGKEIGRIVGLMPKSELKKQIDEQLAK